MRVLPVIVAAAASGIALGAGMSWWDSAAPAPPAPVHGKGPRLLVDAPPPDPVGADGGWAGDQAAASALSEQPPVAALPPRDDAGEDSSVYYSGCRAVRAAGKAPLYRGDPGYRSGMDGDNDGIACENYRGGPPAN